MEQAQIKTIAANVITGGIIIGIIVVGYYVLVKKSIPKLNEVNTVAQIANETAAIGSEIDKTVKDLKDLDRAVETSAIIFELPEFMNLENFSAAVPVETVGRKNPFVATEWKLKIKAVLDAAPKVDVAQGTRVEATSQQTEDIKGI